MHTKKARRLYETIEKSLDSVLLAQAKDWLKDHQEEPWYNAALLAYVAIAKEAGGILSDHKRKVLATIGQGELYMGNPELITERATTVAMATTEATTATAVAGAAVASKVAERVQDATKAGASGYKTHEYLDELYNRVVVPDVRDALVEMEKQFQMNLEDFYQDKIVDALMPDSSKALFQNMGMTFNFNKYDDVTRDYLKDKKIHWAKEVAESTEKEIKRLLVDGYEKGQSTYDVSANISKSTGFSMARAEKIARTETMSACNYANYMAYQANEDVIGFKWRSANTERTRATHRAANGQTRPKGVAFDIGGAKLMFPLDSSLGAPAKEIINCRCGIEPIFVGEEDELKGAGEAGLKSGSAEGDAEENKTLFLEKLDITDEKVVQSTLERYEQEIVKQDYETAVVILADGNVYRVDGDSSTVNPYQVGQDLTGAIITHNHPADVTEYSFSMDDVNLFIKSNAGVLHGIDERYIYELGRDKGVAKELPVKSLGDMTEEDSMHYQIDKKVRGLGFYYERKKRNS